MLWLKPGRKDNSGEGSIHQHCTIESRVGEIGPGKVCLPQNGTEQIGFAHVGVDKLGLHQFGINKCRQLETCISQVGTPQLRTIEIGAGEIRVYHDGSAHAGIP